MTVTTEVFNLHSKFEEYGVSRSGCDSLYSVTVRYDVVYDQFLDALLFAGICNQRVFIICLSL